jgi:hypothetical protein
MSRAIFHIFSEILKGEGYQMRFRLLSLAIIAVIAGCQAPVGPLSTGGFYQSPYQGMGVDGPGPAIVPEQYQPTSLQAPADAAPPAAMAAPGQPMMAPVLFPTSQVKFLGLESLTINWDARVPGRFDSEPLVCPASHDFPQGNIYRLKLSNIPGRQGKELYPTLEIAPTMARTQAFLAHNSVPVEFTDNDFDQVLSGNFITKVVYLPNPEFQGLPMSGVGTLVNTQLEPGVDPIVEASKRGAILAVVRMGNKDLRQSPVVAPLQGGYQGAYAGGGFQPPMRTVPTNPISGVNIPPYGTPMTRTTTGVPGPPQLPQGNSNPYPGPVVRAEPIPVPPTVRSYRNNLAPPVIQDGHQVQNPPAHLIGSDIAPVPPQQ